MEMQPKVIGSIVAGLVIGVVSFGVIGRPRRAVKISPKRYVKALYSGPPSLDPSQMNDTASLLMSNLIYDGLLRFTSNLDLRGAIAESWSTSHDGRVLRFKIGRAHV